MVTNSMESNPLRPLDWRFRLGLQIAQPKSGPPRGSRRSDGHYVRVAHDILVELAEVDGDLHRVEIAEIYPAAMQAYLIYYLPQHREQRELLKAWLLTRESDEVVASRLGLQPDVVEYFEGMFFHIRDRLDCSTWINLMALKRPPVRNSRDSNGLTDSQRWWVYQTFAYHGGPQVLEAFLGGFTDAPARVPSPNVTEWFNERLREQIRHCAVLAASALPVNQRDMAKLATINLSPGRRSNSGQSAESDIQLEKAFRQLDPLLHPDLRVKPTS